MSALYAVDQGEQRSLGIPGVQEREKESCCVLQLLRCAHCRLSTSTLVLVGHFIFYSWSGHALAWSFLAPAEQDGPVPSQVSVLGLMQELQPPSPRTEAGVSRRARGMAGGYCSDPSK